MGTGLEIRHATVSEAGGRKLPDDDHTRVVLDDATNASTLDTSRVCSPENVDEVYIRVYQRPA